MSAFLASLQTSSAAAATPTTPAAAVVPPTAKASASNKPVAQCFLMLGDHVIFSRGIWSESTSPDELQRELNTILAADGNVEQKEMVIRKVLDLVTIKITNGNKGDSLSDYLK